MTPAEQQVETLKRDLAALRAGLEWTQGELERMRIRVNSAEASRDRLQSAYIQVCTYLRTHATHPVDPNIS